MRIATIVSRHDLNTLPDWIEVHQSINAGASHDLHFVVPQSVAMEVHEAAAQLDGHFQSIKVHELEIEPSGGWPLAPNVFFYHCAQLMAKENQNAPWQLSELDCLPLRPNSYDAVSSVYMGSGMPFLGHIGATPFRSMERFLDEKNEVPNPNYGKITPPRDGKSDVMMSGCAVYPGNLILRPNFAGLMASFIQGTESIPQPWDMFLRGAMRADGMRHTDLLAQHWNTWNYRIEDGQIICDGRDSHESHQPGWEMRKCGGDVNPNAAFIHGCKDQSLKNLILGGEIPSIIVPKRIQPFSGVQTPPDSKVEKLEAKVDQLTGMLEKLLKSQSTPVNAPQMAATAPQVPQVAFKRREQPQTAKTPPDAPRDVSVANDPQEGIWPKITKLLSGQKFRLGDLANAAGLPKDNLLEILTSKGYEAPLPGTWVRRKKEELQTA